MTIFWQKHQKLNELQNFVTHIMHMLVINHIFISNGLEALNNKRSSKSRVPRKKRSGHTFNLYPRYFKEA